MSAGEISGHDDSGKKKHGKHHHASNQPHDHSHPSGPKHKKSGHAKPGDSHVHPEAEAENDPASHARQEFFDNKLKSHSTNGSKDTTQHPAGSAEQHLPPSTPRQSQQEIKDTSSAIRKVLERDSKQKGLLAEQMLDKIAGKMDKTEAENFRRNAHNLNDDELRSYLTQVGKRPEPTAVTSSQETPRVPVQNQPLSTEQQQAVKKVAELRAAESNDPNPFARFVQTVTGANRQNKESQPIDEKVVQNMKPQEILAFNAASNPDESRKILQQAQLRIKQETHGAAGQPEIKQSSAPPVDSTTPAAPGSANNRVETSISQFDRFVTGQNTGFFETLNIIEPTVAAKSNSSGSQTEKHATVPVALTAEQESRAQKVMQSITYGDRSDSVAGEEMSRKIVAHMSAAEAQKFDSATTAQERADIARLAATRYAHEVQSETAPNTGSVAKQEWAATKSGIESTSPPGDSGNTSASSGSDSAAQKSLDRQQFAAVPNASLQTQTDTPAGLPKGAPAIPADGSPSSNKFNSSTTNADGSSTRQPGTAPVQPGDNTNARQPGTAPVQPGDNTNARQPDTAPAQSGDNTGARQPGTAPAQSGDNTGARQPGTAPVQPGDNTIARQPSTAPAQSADNNPARNVNQAGGVPSSSDTSPKSPTTSPNRSTADGDQLARAVPPADPIRRSNEPLVSPTQAVRDQDLLRASRPDVSSNLVQPHSETTEAAAQLRLKKQKELEEEELRRRYRGGGGTAPAQADTQREAVRPIAPMAKPGLSKISADSSISRLATGLQNVADQSAGRNARTLAISQALPERYKLPGLTADAVAKATRQPTTFDGRVSIQPGSGTTFDGRTSILPGSGNAFDGRRSVQPGTENAFDGRRSVQPGAGNAFDGRRSVQPGAGNTFDGRRSVQPGDTSLRQPTRSPSDQTSASTTRRDTSNRVGGSSSTANDTTQISLHVSRSFGGRRELTGAEILIPLILAAGGTARVRIDNSARQPADKSAVKPTTKPDAKANEKDPRIAVEGNKLDPKLAPRLGPEESDQDLDQTMAASVEYEPLEIPRGFGPEFYIAGDAMALVSKPAVENDQQEGTEQIEESSTADEQPGAGAGQVFVRPTYLISQQHTLVSIAEDLFHDPNVAWLIADLNKDKIKETYVDSKRIVELSSRQELDLPVWQDVVQFYQNRPAHATPENLVTIVVESTVDRELLNSALGTVMGGSQLAVTPFGRPASATALKPAFSQGSLHSAPSMDWVLKAGFNLRTFISKAPDAARTAFDQLSNRPSEPPGAPVGP